MDSVVVECIDTHSGVPAFQWGAFHVLNNVITLTKANMKPNWPKKNSACVDLRNEMNLFTFNAIKVHPPIYMYVYVCGLI